MSSSTRRSRTRQSSGGSSRISDDQIVDLVSKLQQILPEIRTHMIMINRSGRGSTSKVCATKVLQETCNYIRELNREVEDLSARLSQLLSTVDQDSAQAAIIRNLINMHSS